MLPRRPTVKNEKGAEEKKDSFLVIPRQNDTHLFFFRFGATMVPYRFGSKGGRTGLQNPLLMNFCEALDSNIRSTSAATRQNDTHI